MHPDMKVEVFVINQNRVVGTNLVVGQEDLAAGLALTKDVIPPQVYAGEENVGYLYEFYQGRLQIRIHSKHSDIFSGYTRLVIDGNRGILQ